MKKLGYPQKIVLNLYIDCKTRSKKQTGLPPNRLGYGYTDDEKLVRFMLENSSILKDKGEKCFQNVKGAIIVMCKQMCSGDWCTRSNCDQWDSSSAYHCSKTRPSVCKDYKKYIEKQEAKQKRIE